MFWSLTLLGGWDHEYTRIKMAQIILVRAGYLICRDRFRVAWEFSMEANFSGKVDSYLS